MPFLVVSLSWPSSFYFWSLRNQSPCQMLWHPCWNHSVKSSSNRKIPKDKMLHEKEKSRGLRWQAWSWTNHQNPVKSQNIGLRYCEQETRVLLCQIQILLPTNGEHNNMAFSSLSLQWLIKLSCIAEMPLF